MSAPVSLRAIGNEMDVISNEAFVYLHLPTGELVTLIKRAIHHHGIAEAWYQFRHAAFEKSTVGWLEVRGIPYRRD